MKQFLKIGSSIILGCIFGSIALAAVNVSVNGTTYSIPQTGEKGWGTVVTSWIQAISGATLQPNSGTFTLSSELDFGASYGLKSLYYKSRSSNVSSAGILRLANGDSIGFRNSGNSADLLLTPNATDGVLNYNSVPLVGTTLSQTLTNKTIDADSNTITNIENADIKSGAAIAYSKLNLSSSIVNADVSGSAAIDYSKLNLSNSIVNADVGAAAAIARSKLGTGTASHVVINDGSGNFSSEATLAKSRGGSGQDNSSITFPASGTLTTNAGTQTLTNKTFDDAITAQQVSTPSNPSSGYNKVYFKNDNFLYTLTSGGTETRVGAGGSDAAYNVITLNPDAESGTTGWTASGGTFTTTTTAANVAFGTKAFDWTPSAAQNLRSDAYTIPAGLYGQNCLARIYYKGGDTNYTLQALDGSNVVLGSTALSAATNYKMETVTFVCPTSGSIKLGLVTSASATQIYADNAFVGQNYLVGQVSQAEMYASIIHPGTASCVWTDTTSAATTFTNFSADSDCTTPTGTNLIGKAEAPSTKVPGIKISNLAPGDYYVVATGRFYKNSASDNQCDWRLSDGTNSTGVAWTYGSASKVGAGVLEGRVRYETAQSSVTFQVQSANGSTADCRISNDQTASGYNFQIHVYRYPLSTEQAQRPDSYPASWLGYHGAGCDVWAVTPGTTWTDFAADASGCTLTELKNRNFGTVASTTSGGNPIPGITFTPPRIGRYQVCATVTVGQGTAGSNAGLRLYDGTSELGQLETRLSATSSTLKVPATVCGILDVTSIASTTVKLQANDLGSSGQISLAVNSGSLSRGAYWQIFQLDYGQNAPVLVGSVTSNSTGAERIERARLTLSTGTCSVTHQSGSWLTGTCSYNGGDTTYDYTLTSGIWSDTSLVDCVLVHAGSTASDRKATVNFSTSTNLKVGCSAHTGSNIQCSQAFNIICMGPR